MTQSVLLITIVTFVCIFLIEALLYQGYLLTKNGLKAYVTELKNQNSDLLVKTKVKVLAKQREHYVVCKYKKDEIHVIVNEENVVLSCVRNAYLYKDKYYTRAPKDAKSDEKIEKVFVKPLYIRDTYHLKLSDRGYVFDKTVKNKFDIDKEIIMLKNPFTGEYFAEYEIKDREVLTEVELMKMLPQKMDKYFFDFKAMQDIIEGDFSIPFGLFFVIPSVCAVAIILYNIIF